MCAREKHRLGRNESQEEETVMLYALTAHDNANETEARACCT